MAVYVWIAAGSALGGVARYWLSGVVARLFGETFPWGTLIVNVSGSLLIGVIAAFCGGISSVHGAGAMIVMAVPSFVELPWQRGARVGFAGWIAFISAMLLTQAARGELAGDLESKVQYVAFSGYVLLLVAMGVISIIGGHLGHRLRQQVYESRSIGKYRLQRLLGQLRGKPRVGKGAAARFERGLDFLLCGVEPGAELPALLGSGRLERRLERRQLPGLAEIARLRILKRGRIRGGGEIGERPRHDDAELLHLRPATQ